jgi:DNA-binding transcriptional LysR family regulator
MDELRAMRVFAAVAEAEGFASAAKQLSMSPPAVTRDVANLEHHLGARLLLRSTRRVRLTEAGARYLKDVRAILAEIDQAKISLDGAQHDLTGRITVTAPVTFGRLHVAAHVMSFKRHHPGIAVDIRLHDRVVDLAQEGIDVAIRIAHLPDSSVMAQRVGSVSRILCAAPSYLKERGIPKQLADLRTHDCIGRSDAGAVWRFREKGRTRTMRLKPHFTTNSIDVAIKAAESGLGLVQLLSYQAAALISAGQLKVVLGSYEPEPLPIHVVHLEGRRAPQRVRAFVDDIAGKLRREFHVRTRIK